MIVDDSPINHRVVALSLRSRLATIESAYNGLEAFEKFKQNHYDIVLMDAMMPVMNGCEATGLIRLYEREQNLTDKALIIAMTASDADADVKQFIEFGMDAFMGKPFVLPVFLKLVEDRFKPLG